MKPVAGRLFRSDHLLLTGVTGVLGAHLVKTLLRETDSNLYCLVRARSDKEGKERILSAMRVYDPKDELMDLFEKRVHPVLGDVGQEYFGLDKKSYQKLTKLIDFTIHAAANTNLFANYRRIEPINVGGTKNVIQFVLETDQKFLNYVSTYTVMGDKIFDPTFTFKEQHLNVGQDFEHMTYQHTKFLAENLVHAAKEDGLVWNIYRPGQIFGESMTGYYPQGQANVSQLFYDIFKTVIETGVAIKSKNHFDITPVDYVSNAIVYLATKRPVHYETYHLTNPDIRNYIEIIEMVQELGYDIEMVSQEKYRKLIFEKKFVGTNGEYKSVTTKAFRWWFMRENFSFMESAITDCRYTAQILEDGSVNCPKIDLSLIQTYIDAGIRNGYFPTPEGQAELLKAYA